MRKSNNAGGFFYEGDVVTKKIQRTDSALRMLHIAECAACPLAKSLVKTPRMAPTGNPSPTFYILGEAPGKNEDDAGVQFIGKAGQTLRRCLPDGVVDRVRFNNVIRTRPPNNRTPAWAEIECCRPSIIADIEETQPRAILPFGAIPLGWFPPYKQISRMRGRRFAAKIGNHVCWVYPTYHPSFINRITAAGDDPIHTEYGLLFRLDIQRAVREIDGGIPPPSWIDHLDPSPHALLWGKSCDDLTTLQDWLRRARDSKAVAFDVETNQLRPYNNGKMLSIAFATEDSYLAVGLHHGGATWGDLGKVKSCIGDFLADRDVVRIGHNTSFDLEWCLATFGQHIARVHLWHDTMAQAYVLDERSTDQGLNALSLRYYGYDLKGDSKIVSTELERAKIDDVLRYNVGDAIITRRLFDDQRVDLDRVGLWGVYEAVQAPRVASTTLAQWRGVLVDQAVVDEHRQSIQDQIKDSEARARLIPEVQRYIADRGAFLISSPQHVQRVLTDYFKIKAYELDAHTKSGVSTKEEVLTKIGGPFCENVLEYRGLAKLLSTYLLPLTLGYEESVVYGDGRIHTEYTTTFTATGRLSSSNPNMQNFPKRRHKEIRRVVVADPGSIFVAVDYGQIEARVIAMATKDKRFVEALWSGYDIHMEWAKRFAAAYPDIIGGKKYITDETVMRGLRQKTKAEFVFATFFGATPDASADRMGIPKKTMYKLYDQFWRDFSGVRRWVDSVYRQYLLRGYVEMLTGRRRHAPLSKNRRINTPIQGTAADIVMDAMARLANLGIDQDDPALIPVLNIHDDLTFCVPDAKTDSYIETIVSEMLAVPYTWAQVVPISVEVTMGYNWCDQVVVGEYSSDKW